MRFRLPLLERHGKTALLRTRKAGDLQIVRRALVAFEVPGEAADAALQREGTPALRGHRAVVCRDAAAHRDGTIGHGFNVNDAGSLQEIVRAVVEFDDEEPPPCRQSNLQKIRDLHQ